MNSNRWYAAKYNTRMAWCRMAGFVWKTSRIYSGKSWDQLSETTKKKLKENVN